MPDKMPLFGYWSATDLKILQLAQSGNIFWSRREGGSEAYQMHNDRVHELVVMGYLEEFSPNSCCMREYGITQKGLEALQK